MANKRWLILATVFFATFAFLLSMQTAPPLIPAIIKDFNLSHAEAAGVMLFVALPGMFLSIPGGFMADSYGSKRLCIIGLILVSSGTLLSAVSPTFSLLEGSRTIVGIGGTLLGAAAPPLIFQWFTGKELGLAMGIWALNMPIATIISFNLLSRVESIYNWRYGFWISGIFAAIVLIFSSLFMEEKRIGHTNPARFSFTSLRKINMWVLALIWSAFNMALVSLTTWGKTLFTDLGIGPVQADFLAGLVMLMALVTPLTGYLAGKIGRCRLMILISLVGVVACLFLIPGLNGALLILLLALLGLFAALAPPCIFSLPPQLVGPENTGKGFGILNTALNLGVVAGPLIVGRILDVTKSDPAAFYTMAVFAVLGILLTLRLRIK